MTRILVALLMVIGAIVHVEARQTQDDKNQAAIEKALADLKDKTPSVKSAAIVKLAELGAKDHVKEIAGFLADVEVRAAAAMALEKLVEMGYSKEVAILLTSEVPIEREVAAYMLGKSKTKEVAKDIVRLLKDKESGVRRAAIGALWKLGAKEYAKEIAEILNDADITVRKRAVDALGELQVKEYAKGLAECLKDKEMRMSVVLALAKMDAKEYADDVAKYLNDEDFVLRIIVLQTLGQFHATKYAKAVIPLLQDQIVQTWAIVALVEMGRSEDVPRSMINVLKSYTSSDERDANRVKAALKVLEYAHRGDK